MFEVISDILAHCYDMRSTIINAITFCNGNKMNCVLMFIMSNHYGIIYLSNLLQSESCSNVLSDFWHGTLLWYVKYSY